MESVAIPEGFVLEQPNQPMPEPSGTAPIPAGFVPEEELFGTPAQQAITAAESVAKGIAGPLATFAETKLLGVKPEDIIAREQANPWTAGLGETAGVVGSMVSGYGVPAMIGKGAKAITGLTKIGQAVELGKDVTALQKIGAATITGAIETGLLQGGNEISNAMLGQADPEAPVSSALAHMGAAALLGGGIGGTFSGIGSGASYGLQKLKATDTGKMVGEYLQSIGARMRRPTTEELAAENIAARRLPILKKNAKEVMDAGDVLDVPVFNGQISGDKATQMAEDALLKQPQTVAGYQRWQQYKAATDKVESEIDKIIPQVEFEAYPAGQRVQTTLTNEIQEQAALHKERYDLINEVLPEMDVKQSSLKRIAENVRNEKSVKSDFKAPFSQLARDIAEEIESGNITNVQELRAYQSRLNKRLPPTADAESKRIIGIIAEKLDNLEAKTISNKVDNFVTEVLSRTDMTAAEKQAIWGDKVERLANLEKQIKVADEAYGPFKKKLNELADWLGKGRVGGAQDALNFINNRLEPEDLITKFTSHKYANLPKFLKKEFPEVYEIVREAEKAKVWEAGAKGKQFNYNQVLKKIDQMPKEFRESIFTPEELVKLKAAKTWLDNLPPDFNPSHTASLHSFLEWATSPRSMAAGEIKAQTLKKLVIGEDMAPVIKKMLGHNPSDAEAAAVLKVLSEGSPEGLEQMMQYARKVERGFQQMHKATESIFKAGAVQGIDTVVTEREREKLKKYIDEGKFHEEQQEYLNTPQPTSEPPNFAEGGAVEMPKPVNYLEKHVPQQNMLLQGAKNRIVGVLTQLKPQPTPAAKMFDRPLKNPKAERQYNEAIDLAIRPLSILKDLKQGSLTQEKLKTFNSLYPDVHHQLNKMLTEKAMAAHQRGETPPFKTRQSLSLFLGAALDSSLTPEAVKITQGVFAQQKAAAAQQPQPQKIKRGTAPLSKMSDSYETQDQSRTQRMQRR